MSRKILIVDDEKNIVDILKFNLRKEGFATIEAGFRHFELKSRTY